MEALPFMEYCMNSQRNESVWTLHDDMRDHMVFDQAAQGQNLLPDSAQPHNHSGRGPRRAKLHFIAFLFFSSSLPLFLSSSLPLFLSSSLPLFLSSSFSSLGLRVGLDFNDGQKRSQFSEVDRKFSVLGLWCGWGTADRFTRTLRLENILTETDFPKGTISRDSRHASRSSICSSQSGLPSDERLWLSGEP
jgi:hypothetical protein